MFSEIPDLQMAFKFTFATAAVAIVVGVNGLLTHSHMKAISDDLDATSMLLKDIKQEHIEGMKKTRAEVNHAIQKIDSILKKIGCA